jgi:hypothetical protein
LGQHDEDHHIIWKELTAVRFAVLSFLPHIIGRNILSDEDNHVVCYVLACMTFHSPEMMEELRRLWFMLDNNNIHIKPRHIGPAANTWVDKPNRHLDSDDMEMDPIVFHEMDIVVSNTFYLLVANSYRKLF